MEGTEYGSSSRSPLEPPSSWCHPAHKVHRFIALVLMCFLCFGSYFCYDTPGALEDSFTDVSKLTTSQFAMLYSIYSWPNVILCFIGGYLIDRCFGVRLGTIIYMTFVFIGSVVFAFGVYIDAFWLMILGRFIFGIGGESLQVAVNNYVVLWFKGKELNMVFGLQLSFSRFGSTVNFWVMEPIYRWVANYYQGYERLGVTLFIASLTCVVSLVCALVLGWLDLRAERRLGVQRHHQAREPREPLQPLQPHQPHQPQAADEPFHMLDVLRFRAVFWLVAVICVTYYLAIFPFVSFGKLFFERKFDFVPQNANTVNSMVYLLSAALSPFFGILIDKTGRNVMWIVVSIVTTLCSHFLLAFTFVNPYWGVISLGISYSLLASSLWPLVALIVPESQLGTAYGICQAVQNLGLATVIILAGIIVDKFGYLMLEMFFLACLFVSLIAAVLIYIMDSANSGILNMSPSMRESIKPPAHNNDETENLLNDESHSSDQEEPDAAPPSETLETQSSLGTSMSQSDRIRSRYISQLMPNTNIPERQ